MKKLIRSFKEASKLGVKLGDVIDMPEPVRKVKQIKESE
jgi:hypothetical protein